MWRYGEGRDGLYDFGIAFDIEDRLLELGADGVDGFEGVVLEDFLADFIQRFSLGLSSGE